MSLFDTLKQRMNDARKQRHKVAVAVYSTVIGELGRGGVKEPDDGLVVRTIEKMVNNLQLSQNGLVEDSEPWQQAEMEMVLLKGFLPQKMDEQELINVIAVLKVEDPSVTLKDVMSFLKEHHAGTYDGALASRLAKSMV